MGLTAERAPGYTGDMTNEIEVTEYKVVGSRMGAVRSAFDKLAKRADKLGVPAPALTVLREEAVALRWSAMTERWIVCPEHEAERHERRYIVTVEGEAVQLPGGWKLAGTLQHTEAGNVVRLVPGIGIDSVAFRTGGQVCDHCKTQRARRDTYLVVNDDGEVKRVGSNCIRDFLGHGDPERTLAFAASVLEAISGIEDDDYFRGYAHADRNTVHIADLLAETVAAIDAHGWVSKGNARDGETPTAGHAIDNLFATCECSDRDCSRFHRSNARPTDEQKAEADVVLTYCRDKFAATDWSGSDYEWNLSVATAREWIETRESGVVASAVFYYRRAMEQEIKRAAFALKSPSEHIGALKERLRDMPVTFTFAREFGDEDDLYGVRTLVKFVDDTGNELTWWSSNAWDAEPGERFSLTGTVKKHEEYRGVKSTVLSRCVAKEA